jgi:hypothetical protein
MNMNPLSHVERTPYNSVCVPRENEIFDAGYDVKRRIHCPEEAANDCVVRQWLLFDRLPVSAQTFVHCARIDIDTLPQPRIDTTVEQPE